MTIPAGNTTDDSLGVRPENSPSHRESHDSSRRSIQFNLDGTNSQPPSRAGSFRSLGWSPSRSRKKEREHHVKDASTSTSTGAVAGTGPGTSPNVRTGSPPPPNTYERGVSFDTFDNRDATDFSLTLNYKHKGYQSTRRSRTFLCGTDENEYSDFALEWLMDELVDDGDEIVCLRAVERDSRIASDEGKYRLEAEKLFERVIRKNSQEEKAISLVLELAVGKTEDIIQRMIHIYEPAVLIVGTRGRNLSGMQSLLPGSVSKYCLQQSPIPVIVVRPSLKREKKKKKRLADPARRGYNHILEMSERRGSRIKDYGSSTDSSNISRLPDEEAAVAEALGLPQSYANSRSSMSISERSSVSHDEGDMLSPSSTFDAAVMKSPMAGSVDTSDNESSRPCSADMTQLAGGVVDDSNTPTPQASSTPGASTPRQETESASDTDGKPNSKLRVSVPVIVTEDISDGPKSV